MTLRQALITGFAAASLLLAPASAMAQDSNSGNANTAPASTNAAATPAKPASENWLKVCDPLPDGKKACVMRQVVLNHGQFLGSFILRVNPNEPSRLFAVAAVPVGVILPYDMIWQIDDGRRLRVPYVKCDPQSCASMTAVNEAYVNALKKGKELKLLAKVKENKDLVVTINLAGFTATYDSDTALTYDQYKNKQTGSNALEKALQDQAEQLRQKQQNQTGGGAGSSGTSGTSGN